MNFLRVPVHIVVNFLPKNPSTPCEIDSAEEFFFTFEWYSSERS